MRNSVSVYLMPIAESQSNLLKSWRDNDSKRWRTERGDMIWRCRYRLRRAQEMTGPGMRAHRGNGETWWDMKRESEIKLDKKGCRLNGKTRNKRKIKL